MSALAAVEAYLEAVESEYATGRATEHSYRPALKTLLEAVLPGITAINEPKRIRCGAPDYILMRGELPLGYVEAKDVGVCLDYTENTTQLQRYRASLENLILTDYLEFRFYRFGQKTHTVRIADLLLGIRPAAEGMAALPQALEHFGQYRGESITSPRKLAEMMAAKAVLMRDVFRIAVAEESSDNTLQHQYRALQQVLIHDLTEDSFADVYAQTIAYGLFTARLHDQTRDTFTRAESLELIPSGNPFLKNLFGYVARDLDTRVAWIVDALCAIFALTDIEAILSTFGRGTAQQDPILHFYEDFLDAYDPKLREERGVYYTPQPVVEFIVRAIDDILVRDFGLADGIADTAQVTINREDTKQESLSKKGKKAGVVTSTIAEQVHRVQLLDIATGTGTFLAEAVRRIHARMEGLGGAWNGYVDEHLLPRLHGFEYMMAAYAICHLQLERLLASTGYRGAGQKRLGVYLTNSLEEYHADVDKLPLFNAWLARESIEATAIKRDRPIMIAFGNPPYSGHSANKGAWMDGLMDAYKKEPGGGRLNEKNPKWLNDDYVKFIRLGEHYIDKNGEGILAYITSHGYLDNPTFRGMRWRLLQTFDALYILDLHGNARKKETAPDGGKDDNVFNIMSGVAIIVAVKSKNAKKKPAAVFHHDLWGKRADKYAALRGGRLESLPWQTLTPTAPECLLVPRDNEAYAAYASGLALPEIFPVNSVGIVTARDELTIHHRASNAMETARSFAALPPEDARQQFALGKDSQDWKVEWAQRDLQSSGALQRPATPIHYRPFDVRYTCYTGKPGGFHVRPRGEVMRHMLAGGNVGLVCTKRIEAGVFGHAMIFNSIIDHHCVSLKETNYIFPLYCYEESAGDLLAGSGRTPNLAPSAVKQFEQATGLPFTPESDDASASREAFAPIDVLDYIYAVLHSPHYRAAYKAFLKTDFPRIPLPDSSAHFWRLAALGSELRQYHLLTHQKLGQQAQSVRFPVDGDNVVGKEVKASKTNKAYDNGRVRMNAAQYFEGVPIEAWRFWIGGYQPAQKWLKDRIGRTLSFDDIRHYQKIIAALTATHDIMQRIDEAS